MPVDPITRRTRRLTVATLELVVALGIAILLIGVVPELARLGGGGPVGSPARSPSADTSLFPGTRVPAMVLMSPDADCGACHLDPAGGVRPPVIPVIAHPLDGWRDCTACHANDSLVKTAPGHSSLHRADCLVCHRAPAPGGSPPPRPHHIVTGAACVSCHGSVAPLPTDMAGRQNCWICHVGTEFSQLFGSPPPSPLPSPP